MGGGDRHTIESKADHFLQEARQYHSITQEFNSLPKNEQLQIVKAMNKKVESDPQLHDVHIVTMDDGKLADVTVDRYKGWASVDVYNTKGEADEGALQRPSTSLLGPRSFMGIPNGYRNTAERLKRERITKEEAVRAIEEEA